jgi:hypothetical protein
VAGCQPAYFAGAAACSGNAAVQRAVYMLQGRSRPDSSPASPATVPVKACVAETGSPWTGSLQGQRSLLCMTKRAGVSYCRSIAWVAGSSRGNIVKLRHLARNPSLKPMGIAWGKAAQVP